MEDNTTDLATDLGPGDAVLVQDLVAGTDGDEPGGPGAPAAVDDVPGSFYLGVQDVALAGEVPGAAGPDRSPGAWVGLGGPDRLGLEAWGAFFSRGACARGDGVDDLPVGEGVAVPVEVGLQVPGALLVYDPTTRPVPAASRALRSEADNSMPASATITRGSVPAASWSSSIMGSRVVVSALLPSRQPTRSGKLARSTSRPTMTWGPARRSLGYPTRLRASSSSVRRYRVVTSYRHKDRSPAVVARAGAAAAILCPRLRSMRRTRDRNKVRRLAGVTPGPVSTPGDPGPGSGLDQTGQDHPRERLIAFSGSVEPQVLIKPV